MKVTDINRVNVEVAHMERDIEYLLSRSLDEITSLRRTNEILAAKVEVMDLFAMTLRAKVEQDSRGMSIDLAWELAEHLKKMKSGVGTVEAVKAIMGRDMPMLLDGMNHDAPWIKRLRERSGCTLKEAKDAMDMMLAHASSRDTGGSNG